VNSKERVHAALKRDPTDRVPIFMWFHPATARRLGEALEIPAQCVAEAMGDDVRQAWVGNNFAMEGIVHEHDGDTHVDAWGIEWIKQGAFNQISRSPLHDADENAVLRYAYPVNCTEALLSNMAPVVESAGKYFVGCDVSPCAFEMVCRLRGIERALMDVVVSRAIAARMFDNAAAFSTRLAKAACDRWPLDWLWTGDDVGGQTGMMISPECWRSLVRPALAQVFDVAKSRGLRLAFHSCGSIRPIIPDLVEMGVDVLNPIQYDCPGMDPLELKREYGKDLAFMGGVDTQGVLPHGSEQDVHRATERLLEGMTADGGGYILAASHTVPPETPTGNILAMYEVAGVSKEEIYDRASDIRASLLKMS